MARQKSEISGQSYGITDLIPLLYDTLKSSQKKHGLPELEVVRNGLIIELCKFKDKHIQCTSRMLHSWIRDLYGKNWPQENPPTIQAIVNSTDRLITKHKKLQKQHSGAKKENIMLVYFQEEYLLPQSGNYKLDHSSNCTSGKEMLETQKQKIQQLQHKMYAIGRNAKKRQDRRDFLIEQQKVSIKLQEKTIRDCEKKIEAYETKLSSLKAKLARVNHRVAYWREKITNINNKDNGKKAERAHEIEALKQELYAAHLQNAELREALDAELNSEICTFEGGKYTDDVRACVYELLSLNVGVQKIAPVILCVLKNIVHKSAKRLPKHATTCNMILEALVIVQAQLGDELSTEAAQNTLQTDGTTKYGKHYIAYDVRCSEGVSYTLGVRHVFSGSAQNTLETLKEILHDMDKVQQALGRSAVSSKIVANLKNTISDRHAAEKLFNDLLCDYRAGVLPKAIENWSEMTETEQNQFIRMNNFFCGLHFIVGLADTAEESLKLWEISEENSASSQSGTQRLVRTACKAFHHQGSQQCGCFTLFKEYLKGHQIERLPLARFVGNRFNILFYDAAGVYYLHSHMISYIETVHGNQANRLIQAVHNDLKNPGYIAGCRALGLIDKVITGPLWRKLTESSISVLHMSDVYCEMKCKFDVWKKDATRLTKGEEFLDSAGKVHKDEVWKALVESNDSDTMTTELLQVLFGAFSITTQRMLLDHLPGGQYHCVKSKGCIEEVDSVPTTNVAPERDFAVFDRLLREKPNATSMAIESMILFSHNKTSKWLDQKTYSGREKLIHTARTIAPVIREGYRDRKKKVEERQAEMLMKRQQERARIQRKKQQEKEKLTKDIDAIGGLWMNSDDVRMGLGKIDKNTAKVKALKVQLNFRQKVLQQNCTDKSLFKFSQNRKQFTIGQLTSNLLKLLEDSSTTSTCETIPSTQEILLNPQLLVGKKIKQRFVEDGKLVWYEGTVLQLLETEEFEVKYDDDDDVYCFSLLDDIKNGDLLISLSHGEL